MTVSLFFLICSKKTGTTEPLLPNTFPYLTILNDRFCFPNILFAAINNLSEHNFVAPYRLAGATALSVERAITLFTLFDIEACIIFWAPIIFVLTNS